jgi:hypothetical protein
MENSECGWVKLYHPSGASVTIPLYMREPITKEVAGCLTSSVTQLLGAGFSVNAPGLDDGEFVEEIGFIVRRAKTNNDGSETPVIDLYPAQGHFRLIGKYLNSEDDVKLFEAACKVDLNKLPLYEGDNSIERGKNPKVDKYVVPVKPVKIIWKLNPRYEGESDKKNAKRVFVRWDVAGLHVEQERTPYEKAAATKTLKGTLFGDMNKEQLEKVIELGTEEQKAAARLVMAHDFNMTGNSADVSPS